MHTKSVQNYCEQAIEYLYSRLSGLELIQPIWTSINPGDDYSENYNHRIFLGKGFQSNLRFEASSKTSPKQNLIGTRTLVGSGAWCRQDFNVDSQKVDSWYIFISTNPTALRAPFSEVMPITTIKAERRYAEVDCSDAEKLDEGLVEGISYHTAKEFAIELEIPNGTQVIEIGRQKATKSNDKYHYVPLAVKWIANNGMQQAFDLYMESPAKFKEAITKQ